MSRPVLFVLAGVNGAGKSSIGGHLLEQQGLTWFNPDTFARELVAASGCDQGTANAHAWAEGVRRLDEAIAGGHSHAFETTLGGRTIAARIAAATRTHDVMIWFCGLASPDLHVARVRARVAAGGHDIPEAKIRERYPQALQNLITLMPDLAHLQVYDNSAEVPSRRSDSGSGARAGNGGRAPGVAGRGRCRLVASDTGLGETAGGGGARLRGARGLTRSVRRARVRARRSTCAAARLFRRRWSGLAGAEYRVNVGRCADRSEQ